MSVLDGLVWATLIGGAVAGLIPRLRGSLPWWAAGAVAAVSLHLIVGEPRWQLVPAYAGTLVLVAAATTRRGHSVLAAAAAATATLSLLLGYALPIPRVAPPTELPVGTFSVALEHPDRTEAYGESPGGARLFPAQVWYPTGDGGGQTANWVQNIDAFLPTASAWLDLPQFSLSHLRHAEANAVLDAPPEPGSRPLLLLSHGWGGFRNLHASQLEALASHGYVVAAADHTYGAMVAEFPDGRSVPIDERALPPLEEVGLEVRMAAADLLTDTYAADLGVLLDAVTEMADGGRLDGVVDLDRIGVIGHSTGGGAAVRFCLRDDRCDAVLGLDPWVLPLPETEREAQLAVPFLAVRSNGWVGDENDELVSRFLATSAVGSDRISMPDLDHRDFTMLPLLSPLATQLGLSGPLDARRTLELVDAVLLTFFDQVFREGPAVATVLEGPERPELVFD